MFSTADLYWVGGGLVEWGRVGGLGSDVQTTFNAVDLFTGNTAVSVFVVDLL